MTYSVASLVAGALAGAVLGLVGGFLPPTVRMATATVCGAAGLILGGIEVAGYRLTPLQRDCETPQSWLRMGALLWAVRNGATLGIGATSRIGFWLWYAVPVGALLVADPLWGAAVFGLYGAVRGTAVWLLMFGVARWIGDGWSMWLIGQAGMARRVAAGCLTAIGTAVTIAIGF